MMEDTFDAPQNEQSQGSFDGTNGESQPEAAQVTTPPPQPEYLSKADFEAWQRDSDAKWQTRLNDTMRQAQAKSDKARDTAIRKSNAFKQDYVEAMKAAGIELQPEQIAAVQNQVISREFWTPEAEAAPQYSPQTATNAVAVDEILQHMQANYGVADPSIAQKYAGRDRNDTSWLDSYYDDAAGARTRQASLRKREQEQRQAAQTAAQVKQGFGTTGTLSPGQPSNAQEAEARIKFLMNQQDVTPAQELANWQEIDSLEKKLRASGQWKDEAYQW